MANYLHKTKHGVELDFYPVLKDIPTDIQWVAQHWQAKPRPNGKIDLRHFAYLVCDGKDNLEYITAPAELTITEGQFNLLPLQVRGVNTVPTAVNLFLEATLYKDSNNKWVLKSLVKSDKPYSELQDG